MITGSIEGIDGLDELIDKLDRIGNIDLRPLVDRVAEIVDADLRERMSAGRDPDGRGFAPLAPSTLRYHRGSTTPGGSLGTTIEVGVTIERGEFTVRAGWSGGQAVKAQFFDQGNRHQPARPITGLSDKAEQQIGAALDDFLRSVLDGF